MTNFDEKFMSYALNLAEKTLGNSSPNPSVAAVITQNNIILASATTALGGRPHAEKLAIDKITDKAILKDCTIYVTLEPCFHEGRGPSCFLEIVKNNFKRVVIAIKDHDERTNGRGISALEQAGIVVTYGTLENRAKNLYQPFFQAKNSKLPYVTLKIATSLDGKIATKNFDSKWISNDKSRRFTHYLRMINDAILIGGNTVRKDNPNLNCRISGLEEFSPRKIIISSSGEFSSGLQIFQDKASIITNKKPTLYDIETIPCPTNGAGIDLRAALGKIYEMGINRLLVEAGGNLATQFLQLGLIDRLVWVRSSKIIGNDGIAAIGDLGVRNIAEALGGLVRSEIKEFDGDLVEVFGLV